MNLHRSDTEPQWISVQVDEQNAFQRLAHLTHGVVTPGNIFTIIGLALSVLGLWALLDKSYDWALISLVVGRICDLIDGFLADKTGTKSPLGELLDATVDKIITVAAIAVFFSTDLLPIWLLLILVIPHARIALAATRSFFAKTRLHPSREGKLSMALAWMGLLVLLAGAAISSIETALTTTGYGIVIIAGLLGLYAAARYDNTFRPN